MDDRDAFEQRLASELDEMAGPGRNVDAMAMVRTVSTQPPRWRIRSLLSATRFVVAGAIVALFGGFLLANILTTPGTDDLPPGAATESPAPTATHEVLPGLVTEEVEPGVLRIVRDDAGHDLDETHPNWRYDLDGIAITTDGTVWLTSTYHGTDNQANPGGQLVWAVGRPGIIGIPPPGWVELVPLADGSLLGIGDRVVRFDGTAFVPDDGPTVRPVPGGELWVIEPDELMGLVADGSSVGRPAQRLAVIWNGDWVTLSESMRTASSDVSTCEPTAKGVLCVDRLSGDTARYLEGTGINQVAAAPDGSIWAVGGYEDEGGGLYRISLE